MRGALPLCHILLTYLYVSTVLKYINFNLFWTLSECSKQPDRRKLQTQPHCTHCTYHDPYVLTVHREPILIFGYSGGNQREQDRLKAQKKLTAANKSKKESGTSLQKRKEAYVPKASGVILSDVPRMQ